MYLGQMQHQTIVVLLMTHLEFKVKFCEFLRSFHNQECELVLVDLQPADLI